MSPLAFEIGSAYPAPSDELVSQLSAKVKKAEVHPFTTIKNGAWYDFQVP